MFLNKNFFNSININISVTCNKWKVKLANSDYRIIYNANYGKYVTENSIIFQA